MKTNKLDLLCGQEETMETRIQELERKLAEHKKAEESLRTSEIRYRRLFEAAKDGVLLLDADTGQITDVNPYLVEKLGYSKEEFISKKIWEIGAFRDTALSKAEFRELQEKGYNHYESMPIVTKDGRFFTLSLSAIYISLKVQKSFSAISGTSRKEKKPRTIFEKARKNLKNRIFFWSKRTQH